MTSEINEELWYGFQSDEEAEAKAAKSLAGRVGRIVGAKPFPLAARRLAQVTKDPDCSIDDVVKVLEYDPALSARLLRLVNSAGFALRTACTSVRHAAALVGLERINQVAVTAAIMDMYAPGNKLASKVLEHTTVVGALCRYLGFHFDFDVEELFTCGFLHDIGKLMMLDTEGDEYGALLAKAGFEEHDALHLLEREHYGFDHALLAGHVLTAWNIPDPIPKVVAWHHNVTRAYAHSSQVAQPTSVLRLADALSYSLGSAHPEVEIEKIGRMEAASYLDISEPQIAALWNELHTIEQRARAVFNDGADASEIFSFRPSRGGLRRLNSGATLQRLEREEKPVTPFPSEPPAVSVPPERAPSDRSQPRLSTTPRLSSNPPAVLIEQPSIHPKQFPCVVCCGPSYANTCPACGGYACPEHQEGPDEWCSLCFDEYKEFGAELHSVRSTLVGTSVGAVLTGILFAITGVIAGGPITVIAGALLLLLLAVMLGITGYIWFRRSWFLRSRPNRTAPEPLPTSAETLVSTPPALEVVVTEVAAAPAPSLRPPVPRSLAPHRDPDLPAALSTEAPVASVALSTVPEPISSPPESISSLPPESSDAPEPVSSAPPTLVSLAPKSSDAPHDSLRIPAMDDSPSVSLEPQVVCSATYGSDAPRISIPMPEIEILEAELPITLRPRNVPTQTPRVIVTSRPPEVPPTSAETYALSLLKDVTATSLAPYDDVNPTAPTSRPPAPDGDETLPEPYATVVSVRPRVTVPPSSLERPVSVNVTAPTSHPPSAEPEAPSDGFTWMGGSGGVHWSAIADSHGSAGGW